jgi:hypothetical protein
MKPNNRDVLHEHVDITTLQQLYHFIPLKFFDVLIIYFKYINFIKYMVVMCQHVQIYVKAFHLLLCKLELFWQCSTFMSID